MSTPKNSAAAELQTLAADLYEWADSNDTTPAALVKEHPGLVSAKTLKEAAAGVLEDEDATRLLPAFQAVSNLIGGGGGEEEVDPLYEDLSTAKAVRAQFTRLKMSRTAAKLVIVEGNTGMGKTSAGKIIAAKALALNPVTGIYHVEASAGWGDRPNAMLAAMLKALGMPDSSRSQAARLEKLEEALNQRPVVIILDEVHDVGVRCLRVIKTLLNLTTVKLVLLTHPRLFRDLERENWDDVGQLTGNRLVARVNLGSVQEADVELILERRLTSLPKEDRARAAAELARAAHGNGNHAFVRETILRLRRTASKTSQPLTAVEVDKAIRTELKARKASASL